MLALTLPSMQLAFLAAGGIPRTGPGGSSGSGGGMGRASAGGGGVGRDSFVVDIASVDGRTVAVPATSQPAHVAVSVQGVEICLAVA